MGKAMAKASLPAEVIWERDSPRFVERLLVRWFGRIGSGVLTVELPSGARVVFEGKEPGPHAHMMIRDARLVRRLLSAGGIGLADSYVAGEWDTPDLGAVMALGLENASALSAMLMQSPLLRALNRLRHAAKANTRKGSKRNIAAHYDLGNDFYRRWLDETMTYSSALFERPDEPLADAQRRKYRRLASALRLRPGQRVLEIGCGWGGFAEIAAQEFGCTVVGLTLSREQASFARHRLAEAGLSDRAQIRLEDYRDATGSFDAIASIEMFEAVGEEYWSAYMETLRARLVPGGRAGIQVITIDDDHFDRYRRTPDFIQRYIFPGGMLPTASVFRDRAAAAGLEVADTYRFGASYARTLGRWAEAFEKVLHQIEKDGFDRRFQRLWRYYLHYCRAGFAHGQIDVAQFLLVRS